MMNKLFSVVRPLKKPRVRVFCFPFAGGGANIYFSWKDAFVDDVELVLVQPPGRGARISEKAHESMQDYINELLKHQDYMTNVPYILFGHSLGARVAFELASQLINNNFPPPVSLVASGSRAPHTNSCKVPTFNLSDDEFVHEITRLNGTPIEIMQNEEMMSLILPALRADFKVAETYLAEKRAMPFPIVVFYGDNDPSTNQEEVLAWQELSEFEVEINVLLGDHFFINQYGKVLTERICLLSQNI